MKKTIIPVSITYTEEMLGTKPADPDILERFVLSKCKNPENKEEEIMHARTTEDITPEELAEQSTTIFSRHEDNTLFIWDYQVKGFFKDACAMMNRADNSVSKNLKAYRKVIDGVIFVYPRRINLNIPEDKKVTMCSRSLRAQTAQGDRVCIAKSEQVPEGTTMDFEIVTLAKDNTKYIEEWLEYGEMRGIGQWRNSGKGRFVHTLGDIRTE